MISHKGFYALQENEVRVTVYPKDSLWNLFQINKNLFHINKLKMFGSLNYKRVFCKIA